MKLKYYLKESLILEETGNFYHISINPELSKENIRTSVLKPTGDKPKGLWISKSKYAFMSDLMKLGATDRYQGKQTYNYVLNIDLSNILIVDDRKSWMEFVDRFGTKKIDDEVIQNEVNNMKEMMKSHGTYDRMPDSVIFKSARNELYRSADVDWPKVASSYDGFGITKPGTIKRYSFLADMWRFNSIVLFNSKPIIDIKKIN
jgi:hypothetical protein